MLSIDFRGRSSTGEDGVVRVIRMVMIMSIVSCEPRDSLELIKARQSLSSSALSLLLRFILVAALTWVLKLPKPALSRAVDVRARL